MGTVIDLRLAKSGKRRSADRKRRPPLHDGAEIVLFTGVRYERHSQLGVDVDSAGVRPCRGVSSAQGQT